MTNPFTAEHSTFQDTSLEYQLKQKFIATHPQMDVIASALELNIKYSVTEFVTKMQDILPGCRARMPHNDTDLILSGERLGGSYLIWVDLVKGSEVVTYKLSILSALAMSDSLTNMLRECFAVESLPSIQWWYRGSHGPDSREVFLPPNTQELHPEYYPDMDDPKKVLSEYMASDEAVLLLSGPPGTGKTTLLRYMIHEFALKAHVIYDETLMQSDTIFQDFLFNQNGAVLVPRPGSQYYKPMGKGCSAMIIEDADNILSSRERDGNHLMSRFLNVSDGLIKLPSRKLIFTTNILNHENMDQAILRPGRCFGLVHTRALTLLEAQAAAEVAKVPVPTERREYTLAELFNQGKSNQIKRYGMGFTR